MKNSMRKVAVRWIFPFYLFAFFPLCVNAQDDPEYRMEIGGGVGMMGYLGDYNKCIQFGRRRAKVYIIE